MNILYKIGDIIIKGILFIVLTPIILLLQFIGFLFNPKSKKDFLDNKYD